MKWIFITPIIIGIIKELINILIRIAREPPIIEIIERKEEDTKDLNIDDDLKKYFDYKE